MAATATVQEVQQWQGRSTEERARLEALGQRLRTEAAHLAAAEYRWLVALEEFDREGGWVEQGARSCVQWLSWACGVSPEAGRERLRVAHALAGLPAVSAAFAQGELSYSKVRAVTRIATGNNEEVLVTYARHATASQLEQVVRDHRRVGDGEDAHEAFERRSLHWRDQGDGTTRLSACLPTDVAAEVIAAIERVADDLGEQPAPPAASEGHRANELRDLAEAGAPEAPVVAERWDTPPPAAVRRAEALRIMAETVTAHRPAPADRAERYQVVVHTTDAALAGTGAEPDEASDGGTEPHGTDAEPHTDEAPGGGEPDAGAGGGEPDAGAEPSHASEPDAGAGAADAAPGHAGEAAARDGRAADGAADGAAATDQPLAGDPPPPAAAGFVAGAFGPLPPGGGPRAEAAVVPTRAVDAALDHPGAYLDGGGSISTATARMLACDAGVVWLVEDPDGTPRGVSEKSRAVPIPIRRALADRDKGCRFPGCTNRRFVDSHHVWHWANRGPTALWNLVLLCRFHHRVIHHAGYRMYAYGDQTFSFHRPDGTPIPTAAASPGGRPDQPERANHDQGVRVDSDSLVPDWDGTPPDYDAAAQVLLDATFPPNPDQHQPAPGHDPVSAETPRPEATRPGHDPVSAETPDPETAPPAPPTAAPDAAA